MAEFKALTGLRFIAAAMVFIYHINEVVNFPTFTDTLFRQFYLGVNFFFVLSGFLITYHYYPTISTGLQSFKIFLIKRIARILPLYLFILIGFYLSLFRHNPHHEYLSLKPILINLFILNGYSEEFIFTGIHTAWSLTVELSFYILAPVVFWLYHTTNKLLYVWMIFLAICFLIISWNQLLPDYAIIGSWKFILFDTFPGRSFEFLAGMKVALIARNQDTIGYVKKIKPTGIGFMLMVVSILVLVLLYYSNKLHSPNELIAMFWGNLLFPVGAAFFILGISTQTTLASNFFSHPILEILGKSSYCFYLIHAGFIHDFLKKNITGNFVLTFIILNLISIFLYKTIEAPARKFILNFFKLKAND